MCGGQGIGLDVAFGAVMRCLRETQKIGLRPVAERLHVNFTHLGRWERGERPVPGDMVPALDKAYRANGVLVALHGSFAQIDEMRKGVVFPELVNSESGRDINSQNGDDAMERRSALQALAAFTAGAAMPMDVLEILRSHLGEALGAADEFTVDDWEQNVYEHACALRATSPVALIGPLVADIADLRTHLDHRHDLDQVRMRRVGSQLAALMAMLLTETGDFPTASRWWRIARRAADASGDQELGVWISGRQALVAQTVGMDTLALRLVRDAEQRANGRPSCGLAEARTTRVKILGVQDGESVRRELDDLHRLVDRLPVSVTGEQMAIWGYPEKRLLSVRTGVLTAIGDPDVHDELVSEIAGYGQTALRERARAELKLGWYLINRGDVSEGLETAGRAMAELPAGHRTTAVIRMAARVHVSLPAQARNLPAARDLRALTTLTGLGKADVDTERRHVLEDATYRARKPGGMPDRRTSARSRR